MQVIVAHQKREVGIAFLELGRPDTAIPLLEEAVAIDSTFALAWRGLATHLRNLRINEERRVEALEARLA